MSKTVLAVIVAGLIALGGFFYWGATSSQVDQKQEEIADTITKPLTDAKDVDQLTEDKESANQDQIDDAMGE